VRNFGVYIYPSSAFIMIFKSISGDFSYKQVYTTTVIYFCIFQAFKIRILNLKHYFGLYPHLCLRQPPNTIYLICDFFIMFYIEILKKKLLAHLIFFSWNGLNKSSLAVETVDKNIQTKTIKKN
jgi:hypothetical protein